MNKRNFYNGKKILDKGNLINFILGARGWGKTYYYKSKAIENYLDHKEEFIYLRRTETELSRVKDKLFNDVHDYNIICDGDTYYLKDGDKKEKIGYCIPLSISTQYRSASFDNVTLLIFDEFVITGSGRYLKNEPELFLDFLDTVVRNRDNLVCVCLGNRYSSFNPYFTYFNIHLQDNQKLYSKNGILVERNLNEYFEESRNETKLGRIIRNTKYGDYSLKNKPIGENDLFILDKPFDSKLFFNFLYAKELIGIWYSRAKDIVFIGKGVEGAITYCFDKEDFKENSFLFNKMINTTNIRFLKFYYFSGKIGFQNLSYKVKFYEIGDKL